MTKTRVEKPGLKFLSVVIPARNEESCIATTVEHLFLEVQRHNIPHEIIVVDDGSTDATSSVIESLKTKVPTLRLVQNPAPHGFGRAVSCGFDEMNGDAVVVMMADESDDCHDVVRYWNKLNEGYDCVFGSRFVRGGSVIRYPRAKLVLNRFANHFISQLFRINLNDTTNAFKAYRKEVIDGCRPFIAPHFNMTIEVPLKAIVRGYSWVTIPTTWRARDTGTGKLKIKEMGSRYLFICLYIWVEKYFSRRNRRRVKTST